MPRHLKFTVYRVRRGLYRITIPARFSSTGKQQAVYYPTSAEAERDAARLRGMVAKGTLSVLTALTSSQVKDAREALATLEAAGLHITLADAAKLAALHSKAVRHGATVADMLERYESEVGAARGWKPATRASWRKYARPMAAALGSTPCAELAAPAVRDWLRGAFPTVSAFNGAHRTLSGAFAWAVKQHLAAENPFAAIDKLAAVQHDVDVFTPQEARAMISACRDMRAEPAGLDCSDCKLAVALLLFAGVRPQELTRLAWTDIKTEADGNVYVFVSGRNAKTKTGVRFIRVRPNLKAFISAVPPAARQGKLIPPNWSRKVKAIRAAAGLSGRQDTPRHSFASYALAAGEPVHAVMADMGHTQSSTVIYTNYRAAATPAAAMAYWSIRP